jgi:hypothetical protein
MSPDAIEVLGTLRADGTLLLAEKPNLPPGPVKVRVQPLPQSAVRPAESLADYVQRTRRELEARGSKFMNDEEVSTWVEQLRADDDRIEQAYRQVEAERARPGNQDVDLFR